MFVCRSWEQQDAASSEPHLGRLSLPGVDDSHNVFSITYFDVVRSWGRSWRAGVVGFRGRRAGSDTDVADVGGTRTAGSLVRKGVQ